MFKARRKKVQKFVAGLVSLSGDERRKAVTSPHLFTMHDWKVVLLEARISSRDKKLPILAAGSAFFAGLAFFPLLAGVIAVVAHTLDVNELKAVLSAIEIYFPIDIAALIGSQIESAFEYNLRNIVVAILAIVIALYASTKAMYILISATNIAYEQEEKRKFNQLYAMSFVMALGAIFMITVVLALVLVDQSALEAIGVPALLAVTIPVVRWILLAIIIASSLALFYRFAISTRNPHWKWVSWGAGIASVIWLAGTTLFFLYAKYLSVYSSIYNVFGSVVVLLIWLNLSAFIILLGAVINHRLEDRTTRRTSV